MDMSAFANGEGDVGNIISRRLREAASPETRKETP